MNKRMDPAVPLNYSDQVSITPTEFELQVKSWMERAAIPVEGFRLTAQGVVAGDGGDYKIDVLGRLLVFGDAEIVVLAECKHQKRAVERDEILVLEGKLRDAGAHKGMLFSTSGFQKGALDYAQEKGIATISVLDGQWLYETKSFQDQPVVPPEWAHFPRFAGVRLAAFGNSISCHTIDDEQVDAIKEFLAASGQ